MTSEEFTALEDSSKLLPNHRELSVRIKKDGYLFFKNILDISKIETVKTDLMKILRQHKYLSKNTFDDMEWSGNVAKVDEIRAHGVGILGDKISQLDSIEKLYKSEILLKTFHSILGEEVYPWQENNERIRIIIPNDDDVVTTGAYKLTRTIPLHQDNFFFRSAYLKDIPSYTAWIPLMKINRSMGGIAILKNSHKRLLEHFYLDNQMLGIPPNNDYRTDWINQGAYPVIGSIHDNENDPELLRSDYSPGDVVIMHNLMAHKGLTNNSNLVRISADFRYQAKNTPTFWRSKNTLEFANQFRMKVTSELDNMGIKGQLKDRILWGKGGLAIEGPSNTGKSIKSIITEKLASIS